MDFASVDWREWQCDNPLSQAERDEMWMTAILEDRGRTTWEVEQAVQALVRRVRVLEARQGPQPVIPHIWPDPNRLAPNTWVIGSRPGTIKQTSLAAWQQSSN